MFKVGDTVHSENLGTTRMIKEISDTHIFLESSEGLKLKLLKAYVEKNYKVLTLCVNTDIKKETTLFKAGDIIFNRRLNLTRTISRVKGNTYTLRSKNRAQSEFSIRYVHENYELHNSPVKEEGIKASNTQIGGHHYTDMGIQPLEYTYANYGYIGLKAAIHTKVNKYLGRVKDNEVEQLKKARHCLDLLIEKAEKEANK